jgi:hypothetical protein
MVSAALLGLGGLAANVFAGPRSGTAEGRELPTSDGSPFRGVFFNPLAADPVCGSAWLLHYAECREAVERDLRELVEKTDINLIDLQVLIPWTLADPKKPPRNDSAPTDWVNMATLNNLVSFIDYCGEQGVSLELDLATNMWLPYSVDTASHIANTPWWPEPDSTPWTEAAVWYKQIIEYVEAHVRNTGSIALWCMMGNYSLGGAEPALWGRQSNPEVTHYAEQFVKQCWPIFRTAGARPKAAPIALPIFADTSVWRNAPAEDRLSGVSNLKKWILDDLQLPPDFWVITTYVNSDPARDGVRYLDAIVEILGRQNASKIISTDFKAIGIDFSGTIIDAAGMSSSEMLDWNFRKSAEYGFAGWWLWCYRDTPTDSTGIRKLDGSWKDDIMSTIRSSKRWRADDHSGKEKARGQ